MIKVCTRKSKDGNRLYVEYYEGGERVRKSLNLLETKANIAYVNRNIIPEIERKLKYGLRFDDYKISEFTCKVLEQTKKKRKLNTYETYESAIRKFFSIMGDVSVNKLRTKDIDRYVELLEKQGMSSATITMYLAPISLACKEAIRIDVIDKNPVTYALKPPVKNKEKKVFNLMQMHNLLNNAEGELKTFLYFAFFTGARPNEVLALRWEDIKEECINIRRTRVQRKQENLPKGGKERQITLLKPLKDFISKIENKNGKVFKSSYSRISYHFYRLQKEVGYERRVMHTIRHTFASLLLQARENPTLIQYFLGHASLKMLNNVYAHYIEDEKDTERIEKIFAL
ncbi:tyrosine-type recombinase/integrase [Sulfurospirillum sp. UCH001]|uniref:tyrosine-type recombinase/integrase n=1 Tax=Sulfurospirillum sp. UCH001 TaxID=1581011 RepID=UPI0008366108|nr:tyrosine-type recombinase/integrase [Sulfurospirillum sp. UCH001]